MSKNKSRRENRPSYSVSQNFLTSRGTIDRLIRRTNLNKRDFVLEIGAGKGHITRALLERCERVCAVEIDPKLYAGLKERFAGEPGLSLVPGDFMKMSLPQGPYKVFSNIPFSMTTQIVRRLAEGRNPPSECWLVVEKGAAKRFCGKPAETHFSLMLRPFFQTEVVYHFQREDFHPAPSVETVLLHLSLRAEPDLPLDERRQFEEFLRLSEASGVCGRQSPLSKKQVSTALRLSGLPPLSPSGNMLYVQWLCLFRCWRQLGRRS